jgi:hypothetical protein
VKKDFLLSYAAGEACERMVDVWGMVAREALLLTVTLFPMPLAANYISCSRS